MLIGKAKENFDNWLEENKTSFYSPVSGYVSGFDFLPFSMQCGIIIKWLDSVGIEVYSMPVFREKCDYDSFKRDGWTFEVVVASPCQFLTWADFNQCAEEIDEQKEELEKGERDWMNLNPSVPTREEAIKIGIEKAIEIYNENN
jgi:hypothetical protein